MFSPFASLLTGFVGTWKTYSGEELKGRSVVHGRVTQTRIIILWSESITPGHHKLRRGGFPPEPDCSEAIGDDTSTVLFHAATVTTMRQKLKKLSDA